MNKIHIEAKNDFLERIASAAPMKALAELVWNGLDAGSDQIDIQFTFNELQGVEKITVRDFGTGIEYDKLTGMFGNLGDSWKKSKYKHNGRALHGKSGQGRFKAFALGNKVEWNTVYSKAGQYWRYQIFGHYDTLDALQSTDPMVVGVEASGTEVTISEITKSLGVLLVDTAHEDLAKQFAAYLSQYPEVTITYGDKRVNPDTLQLVKKDIELSDIEIEPGKKVKASVSVVEWNVPTKRAIYLCDSSGVSIHETESGVQVRAPGFQFTAYVKCDYFRELDKENNLILEDAHPAVEAILKPTRQALKTYFRRRIAERQRDIVERWKKEHIYPYEDRGRIDPVEEAERQVFDILAVNVESYLPAFEDADPTSKKFMFLLLAQALRQNPESVQRIIIEVLNLKEDEKKDLAELLNKTTLSSIISSAKTVANRLDFLEALDGLLFHKETKRKLLERDQLHKILEKEAWIFHEEFALSGSELKLEEVLVKHIGVLGVRADGDNAVVVGDDKTGRIDLMLSRAIQPRVGEHDYLVVELKRPAKKIDEDVITQVKKYAMAVANDERFHGVPANWTFVAVSNEMNDYAKSDSSQPHKPLGQVYEGLTKNGRITVWIREWADVINCARARLDFLNTCLSYEADRDSATNYLLKTHAKYIPLVGTGADNEGSADVTSEG